LKAADTHCPILHFAAKKQAGTSLFHYNSSLFVPLGIYVKKATLFANHKNCRTGSNL
jgi:hypothetical protein